MVEELKPPSISCLPEVEEPKEIKYKNFGDFCQRNGLAKPVWNCVAVGPESESFLVSMKHPGLSEEIKVTASSYEIGISLISDILLPKCIRGEVLQHLLKPFESLSTSLSLLSGVEITTTSSHEECNNWIRKNATADPGCSTSGHKIYVVWDTEFLDGIRITNPKLKGAKYQHCITQLFREGKCLVFHHESEEKEKIPLRLRILLETSSVIKYCYDPNMDVLLMEKIYRLKPKQVADVRDLIKWESGYSSHASLNRIVGYLLGIDIQKSKKITMSDWSVWPLSPEQLNYAVMDVVASDALVKFLCKVPASQNPTAGKFPRISDPTKEKESYQDLTRGASFDFMKDREKRRQAKLAQKLA